MGGGGKLPSKSGSCAPYLFHSGAQFCFWHLLGSEIKSLQAALIKQASGAI